MRGWGAPREARAARGARTAGGRRVPPALGRPGCALAHLPAGCGGPGRGGGTAGFAASSGLSSGLSFGSTLGPAAAGDCGGNCAGAGRGRARRMFGRGRRAAGRRTKPPFFPPPPPRPSPGPPPPPGRGRGGLGRSRDPLPPLRPFPAEAARARTCEVGHRSGEKPGAGSREGGRAEGAGRERSRSWRGGCSRRDGS